MEILGIGLGELVAIVLVMLVIVGPERMLRWAYLLGQYVSKLQGLWRETAAALQKELDASKVGISVPKDIPTRQSLTHDMNRALRNLYETHPAAAARPEVVTPPAVPDDEAQERAAS